MPRISRVPSMAAFSLALPTAARWLRPKGASASLERSNAGGLAQGPEEKRGFAGRVAGYCIAIDAILPDKRPSLGRGVPPPGIWPSRGLCKSRNDAERRFGDKMRREYPSSETSGGRAGGVCLLHKGMRDG